MNINQIKKSVAAMAQDAKIRYERLRSRTVDFTDLARAKKVFIYLVGVEYDDMAKISAIDKAIYAEFKVLVKADIENIRNVPTGICICG